MCVSSNQYDFFICSLFRKWGPAIVIDRLEQHLVLIFEDKGLINALQCLTCLIYEMLYIRELSPSLNVQSDSIKAKLFV